MGARRRPLSDDDVELVILERGVEFFFEHRLHAMDLVEKQHLPLAQIGEDGGQIALNLQSRARGLLKANVELVGDDGGQRGLAQPRRPEEQHMIQRFAARLRRFKGDRQLLFRLGLADELAQPARAQLELKTLLFFSARGADQPFRSGFHEPVFVFWMIRRVVARDRHDASSVAGAATPGKTGGLPEMMPGYALLSVV